MSKKEVKKSLHGEGGEKQEAASGEAESRKSKNREAASGADGLPSAEGTSPADGVMPTDDGVSAKRTDSFVPDPKDYIVQVRDVVFDYYTDFDEEEGKPAALRAIDGVSIDFATGSFTAVIGKNGSGKSTLAKNLNGLLIPSEGVIYVDGIDTLDDDKIWEVRQTAGMVFQNPDNQLVSAVVEDDVAFGPENMGIESSEIRRRVDKALEDVKMGEYKKKAPHQLSGGQKQRIAIAGVIAMRPKCIIFDEPTAMLDPRGRRDIMRIIDELHREGITVILITHFMDEAVQADRIIIMDDGKILLDGTPEQVFMRSDVIKEAHLDVPLAVEIADGLRSRGIEVPQNIITEKEMVEFICQYE